MKQAHVHIILKSLYISMISLFLMCLFLCNTAQAKDKNLYKKVTVEQGNGNSKKVKVWQIPHAESKIYTVAYRKKADKFIAKKQSSEKCTLNKPLLILNPYGTFTTSVYFYAKTTEKCYAECTIKASGAETITRDLKKTKKYSKKQEYLISNLVAGSKNTVILRFYNKKDKLVKKIKFSINMESDPNIPEMLTIEQGTSKEEISEGIYAIIGHDRYLKNNVYFYDNNGVNRGRIPLFNYRADRLITVSGNLIYPYSSHKIAMVNRLGRVVKKFNIGTEYKMHHDLLYDNNTGKLICLVSNTQKETIEDEIISINIKTGTVKLLVDWEKLMPDVRSMAVWGEGNVNTYGGTELDWIHLNSLDLVDPGELVVSSREQSTIIKINDLYDTPVVRYLIHDGVLYDSSIYGLFRLNKIGDFVGQSGQHTISVERDDSLPDGQYYLYMFNNNFAFSYTLPFYNWKNYFPTAGNFVDEPHSYYYKYLVDENEWTYELVQSIELPYSRLVSGVQHYNNHITFGSGFAHQFGEFDSAGNLISMFTYQAEKYSYRVTKYNFRSFFYRKKNWK